jgi:hypothetical protein
MPPEREPLTEVLGILLAGLLQAETERRAHPPDQSGVFRVIPVGPPPPRTPGR